MSSTGGSLDQRVLQLWGKADPQRAELGHAWHPVLCHMVDVAACARVLLTELYPARLSACAELLQLDEASALAWLTFSVALHDLGKVTPAFQAMVPERAAALASMGLDFPDGREPHGSMSAVLVFFALERFKCPLARGIADAVAAHHGNFVRAEEVLRLQDAGPRNAGRSTLWAQLRSGLVDALAQLTGVERSSPPTIPATCESRNAFLADLAGLTTVADWLGSNADVFSYCAPPDDLDDYASRAEELARASMRDTGFRPPPRATPRSFEALFERKPWPLHDAMAQVLPEVCPGSLIVVEAPMGEGKTEAALLLYDTLAARQAEGLYFALPTQATANQILGRIERFLAASFAGQAHGLHLVHGGAGLSDRYAELRQRAFRTRSVGGVAGDSEEGPIADAWFAQRKRALLAPLAVGTVDQALLGVLRSKHHFLRLHGLARKVIVVDEVHAYDTFTSEILARTCCWLRALGSTVVLLSATLSSPQRARLLASYDVSPPPAPCAYPRITLARDGMCRSVPFSARRPPITIQVEWKTALEIFQHLAAELKSGGCVAWIVNTVSRAQSIFATLVRAQQGGRLPSDLDLSLLHARFPHQVRQQRERMAEDAFGPPERAKARPRAAILVGTQVLEQSLDLDFDLMITDLAPVDLVLQRAGRLQRHERAERPLGHERRLWIARPEAHDDPRGPTFGPSARIYDESVLLRSWLQLDTRATVTLPTDIEPLVEAVYAPGSEDHLPAPVVARLRELDEGRANRAHADAANAEGRELPHPAETSPFRDFSARFDDEDPTVHAELRAITRLGELTVTVVPMISHDGRLYLWGEDRPIDVDASELSYFDALRLARQAFSIGRPAIARALLAKPSPRAFARSGLLRHHRVLPMDSRGHAEIPGGVALHLRPDLGLVIGELEEMHPFSEDMS